MSLCHMLVILAILKLFHYNYICYGDLWSVIFDATAVSALGIHELYPWKRANLTNNVCVLPALLTSCSTIPLPPFRLSYSLKLKLGQLIILQGLLISVQVKGRITHLSFLNQKLEMIKPNEEGVKSQDSSAWVA